MKRKDGDLYLLQDGTHAYPKDCSTGKDGVLRHKNGLAVAMTADGEPQTVSDDAVRNGNVMAAEGRAGEAQPNTPPATEIANEGWAESDRERARGTKGE